MFGNGLNSVLIWFEFARWTDDDIVRKSIRYLVRSNPNPRVIFSNDWNSFRSARWSVPIDSKQNQWILYLVGENPRYVTTKYSKDVSERKTIEFDLLEILDRWIEFDARHVRILLILRFWTFWRDFRMFDILRDDERSFLDGRNSVWLWSIWVNQMRDWHIHRLILLRNESIERQEIEEDKIDGKILSYLIMFLSKWMIG